MGVASFLQTLHCEQDAPKPWEQQLVENITGFFSKGDVAGGT